MPLNAIKNYQLIFNESLAPQIRPGFDRSPTNVRRNLNNTSPPQQQQQQQTSSSPNNINNNASKTTAAGSVSMTTTTTTALTNIKPKLDLAYQQRNALSSSLTHYRRSTTNLATASSSAVKTGTGAADDAQLTSQSLIAKKNTPQHMSLAATRTRTQFPLNTLELKPSTVEVYFRSSSGKSQRQERKSIPATLFPPPKIGLKS